MLKDEVPHRGLICGEGAPCVRSQHFQTTDFPLPLTKSSARKAPIMGYCGSHPSFEGGDGGRAANSAATMCRGSGGLGERSAVTQGGNNSAKRTPLPCQTWEMGKLSICNPASSFDNGGGFGEPA